MGVDKLLPYFRHLLPDVGEIQNKRLHIKLFTVLGFVKIAAEKAVVGIKLHLCLYRETERHSDSKLLSQSQSYPIAALCNTILYLLYLSFCYINGPVSRLQEVNFEMPAINKQEPTRHVLSLSLQFNIMSTSCRHLGFSIGI
jgi:hypothetical protein